MGLFRGLAAVFVLLLACMYAADAPARVRTWLLAREPLLRPAAPFRRAWNGTVPLWFPGSARVQQLQFNRSRDGFVPEQMEARKPVVIKGSRVLRWPAMARWRNEDLFASRFDGLVKAHTPSGPVVRVHHVDQPFEGHANWTRPFVEQTVSVKRLLRGDALVYAMVDIRQHGLAADVRVKDLTVPWRAPLETNLWMGTTGITTPCHFDMVHNMYAQLVGHKRWLLFPPEAFFSLYTFTRLHPSVRQTQIDFFRPETWTHFPGFPASLRPLEVVLGPGDVLYIPPFWFHQVSVVTPPGRPAGDTNAVSISVSVHTTSEEVDVRARMIDRSLALPVGSGWSLAQRICAMEAHARGLFASRAEGRAFVHSLLNASYSHWHFDEPNAIGLHRKIEAARKQFPRTVRCEEEHETFRQEGITVRRISQGAASLDIAVILLSDYLQDTIELVLGDPLMVDPFLRRLLDGLN